MLKTKKFKALLCVSVVVYLFIVCNGLDVMNKVATKALNFLQGTDLDYYYETKKVSFESAGYEDNLPGDYHIDKSADWISIDEALIEFDITTNVLTNGNKKDIIFVVDTSGSMVGDKYARLTEDATELITKLLIDQENTVSLIAFDSEVEILRTYSKDKDDLINTISTMDIYGATDYYLALTAVDEVLSTYVPKEGRDCVVIFLTDGFPTQSNTNQLAEFQIINSKYPYVKIHGIQYEMGIDITEELKEVSHKQYSIDMDSLRNVLFEAAFEPLPYEDFELVDYINNQFFYVESEDDIDASFGTITLAEEEGKQKVVWNVSSSEFLSGSKAILKIKVKLKNEYLNIGGLYPTNEKVEVKASIDNRNINESGPYTPTLKRKYMVSYDMNTPTGCNLQEINGGEFSAFESVELTSVRPTCENYTFLGWEATTELEYINDDYFIMPTQDVTFRAIWSTFNIDKTMDGTVYEVLTLYDTIKKQAVLDNISSEYVDSVAGIDFNKPSSDTNGKGVYILSSTLLSEYPIYYFRGNIDNNNVIFANYCWKIVRTTETGGIKMIFNGLPSESGTCNNTGTATAISTTTVAFNATNTTPGYTGYMYNKIFSLGNSAPTGINDNIIFGKSYTYDPESNTYTLVDTKTFAEVIASGNDLAGYQYTCFSQTSTTCATMRFYYFARNDYYRYYMSLKNGQSVESILNDELFADNVNVTNSTIKTSVDNWYSSNMTGYTKYLENTVYCNDRTVNHWAGYDPNDEGVTLYQKMLYFGALERLMYREGPTLACSKNDSFTLSVVNGGTEGYGNSALKYPVALLSSDEAVYAGGAYSSANSEFYLYNGEYYWLMTPFSHRDSRASSYILYGNGQVNGGYSKNKYIVRPVISLKNNTIYSKGNGSMNNPFVIMEDGE